MFKNITFINALHWASFTSYIEIALLKKKTEKSAFLQEYFFPLVSMNMEGTGITSGQW